MAKNKKKKPKYNQNAIIRGAVRRAFARSPAVKQVKDLVRKEFPSYKKDGSLSSKPSVRYQCAICQKYFPGKDVAVDHIDPVVDVDDGFVDWNTFIDRLFCGTNNLQVLCSYKLKDILKYDNEISCHLKKTREERQNKK